MSEPKLVPVGPNQLAVNDVNAMPQRGQSAEKLWAFIAIRIVLRVYSDATDIETL